MKINKSMQEANKLSKQLHAETSKQTEIMVKEHQEKELIKLVKESVFQVNKEVKSLNDNEDLVEVFLSLESLYATMVNNNIVTDIVSDIQDKEYIENVYNEISKNIMISQKKY